MCCVMPQPELRAKRLTNKQEAPNPRRDAAHVEMHHPKSRAEKIEEMELTEEVFQTGDNIVVDKINKGCAEMLVKNLGILRVWCDWSRY